MSQSFRLTDAARDDLLGIWDYVFSHESDDRRADRVIDRLYETFAHLPRHPELGTVRARLPAGRLAFAKNGCFLVYVIFDDGIEITRVSGGDDDWLR